MTRPRYDGMPVLVTGAQGFIGSWLVQRLLREGATVLVPRRPSGEGSLFAREGLEARCVQVDMDLQDLASLIRAVNEHDVREVFHLGARTIVADANRSPMAAFDANVRGTYNLLEACRVADDAPSARGGGLLLPRLRPATPATRWARTPRWGPAWPYDVSKACADMIARCYAATWDLPVGVTRLANVYGGGDLNYSRLVPDAARALVAGRAPVIHSDGTPERDFIYVEDAVDAYLAVADSLSEPRFRGRAWNAGSGSSMLCGRAGAPAGCGVGPRPGGRGGGRAHRPRRRRPPVPGLERHPGRARLDAPLGRGGRPADDLRLVRVRAGLSIQRGPRSDPSPRSR